MKIDILKIVILLFAGLTVYTHGQTNNSIATTNQYTRLLGSGVKILSGEAVTNVYPNSYPYTRIAGDGEDKEYMSYIFDKFAHRQSIPEIMPVAQDINGNWGTPTDGMQLSVRFHQAEFLQGDLVPAYMVLRNLGSASRRWWRNGFPDCGYQFALRRGTNVFTWMRLQQKPMTAQERLEKGIQFPDLHFDPCDFSAAPKTEDLTILYLNRFFDLSQTGTYSLQVQIRVPALNGKGDTNVISGTAAFEVVPKPSY